MSRTNIVAIRCLKKTTLQLISPNGRLKGGFLALMSRGQILVSEREVSG